MSESINFTYSYTYDNNSSKAVDVVIYEPNLPRIIEELLPFLCAAFDYDRKHMKDIVLREVARWDTE